MVQQHADQHVQRDDTGKAMKRRGILAAAGAVVAAIVAKQTAQQVDAVAGNTTGQPLIIGAGNDNANPPNSETQPTYLVNNSGVATAFPIAESGTGLFVIGSDGAVGIEGSANGSGGRGVWGRTDTGVGVYGFASSSTSGATDGIGVYGVARNPSGRAVQGQIVPGTPNNTSAVFGWNQSTGTGGIGVQSLSTNGTGVQAVCTNGIGGSFQGGVAPLRLVPGSLSARSLTASGHQVGELYVTSDARLFFFDGNAWREILLAGQPGILAAPASRPSSQSSSPGPVTPAPLPHPRP